MSGHEHCNKVLDFVLNAEHNWVASLYGCTGCDATQTTPFESVEQEAVDHTKCGPNCFGCKAQTLQLNSGDASRDVSDKKWQSRLKNYADAKAQGIQPAGTTPEKVQAAITASQTLNRPYNAEKMPPANKINKRVATTMKEVGL